MLQLDTSTTSSSGEVTQEDSVTTAGSAGGGLHLPSAADDATQLHPPATAGNIQLCPALPLDLSMELLNPRSILMVLSGGATVQLFQRNRPLLVMPCVIKIGLWLWMRSIVP
jgi:hypothetical protein